MAKTALQQLIEQWEEIQNTTFDSSTKAICGAFIDSLKIKLYEERQQIEESFEMGKDDVVNSWGTVTPSNYYTSKYTK